MQGKRIAVTGGFGALGCAVAKRALEQGARVALIDVSARMPAPFSGVTGGQALAFGGVDLTDEAVAQATFQRIGQELGGLDALLNVAGTFRYETVVEGGLATWDLLYATNLRTAVAACMAAIPLLERSTCGAIVNVGAYAAAKAGLGMAAYAASKAGVAKLTESLAEELKGRVTVNAVLPSIIDTPANRKDMPSADFDKWVPPTAVADAMLFLASDQARSITGALLPVAGLV